MTRGIDTVLIGAWWIACWAAGVAIAFAAPPSTVAFALVLACVPYAVLLTRETVVPSRTLVGLTLLGALPMLVAPAALSDDVYRFLWDGRVWTHGIDPYLYAPADPALHPLRDALWRNINHPEIPTIYPPVAQLLFGVVDWVWHSVIALRVVALGGHVLIGWLLVSRGPRWAPSAWLLNPLALSESALGAHVDVWVGLAVLLFAFALRDGRVRRAIGWAFVAAGVKLVGIVLAPLVAIRSRRWAPVALALVLVPIVPLLGAGEGSDATGGFGQYARRWEGNAGLFAVVKAGMHAALEGGEVAPGRVRFDSLRPMLERARDTRWDPRASFLPDKKPIHDAAEFETHVVASLLARGIVALFVVLLAIVLALRRVEPTRAVHAVVFAVLLLAPQIHPWYLLWLLPLHLALGRRAVVVWSVAILAAYAPLDGWLASREWQQSPWVSFVQYAIVAFALAVEILPGEKPASDNAETRELSPRTV